MSFAPEQDANKYANAGGIVIMVKVLKLFDFTKCELPDVLFDIKVKQEDIDFEIIKAAEHFLTIEQQDGPIENGDIVAVKIVSEDILLASECERLSVGKGFFSKDIESALVGKKKGETFTVTVGGSVDGSDGLLDGSQDASQDGLQDGSQDGTKAEVTVLWIRRRVVPKFTDEMASAMGVEDVSTVSEYTDYVTEELANEDKEKKQNAIWLMVSKKLLEESEFEVDQADIDAQYKKDIAYLQGELEDDFEEYMQVKYHGSTLEESKQGFREEIERTLKLCAIAEPMAKEEGVEWTREVYDATIDEMVSEDYTREELEASMSYEDYVKQQLEEFLKAVILEYFDERFTVTVI